MEFTSKLSGNAASIYGKQIDYNHEIHGSFIITWHFYTEMREWGVKDISVYATKVYGTVEINIWTDDKEEFIEFNDQGWNITNYTDDIKLENSITPQDIEIDYETNTITINF